MKQLKIIISDNRLSQLLVVAAECGAEKISVKTLKQDNVQTTKTKNIKTETQEIHKTKPNMQEHIVNFLKENGKARWADISKYGASLGYAENSFGNVASKMVKSGDLIRVGSDYFIPTPVGNNHIVHVNGIENAA